jgi:ribonucleotide monophosphatase NagD (HAD superfamily)
VMIGDNVETDIKGGKGAGLSTVLITRSNVQPAADHSQADLVVRDLRALLHYFDH